MDDEHYMNMAIELARMAAGQTSPNPIVGAVLVKNGAVVGVGVHLRAGEAHAEVHALCMAGAAAQGATLYVTLEPCSHHGRTPPCADALIAAGVTRVVAAVEDPSPWVAGQGIARLRAAGVAVAVGCLGDEARRDNAAYLHFADGGLPYVTLKLAATLDGFIAASGGESRYITGAAARREVHALRSRVDAVLVGAGTVLQDDPALTVRFPDSQGKEELAARQPLRVVLDSLLRLPRTARVVQDQAAPTLVACSDRASTEREQALVRQGVEIARHPERDGRLELRAVLDGLAARGCRHVLVEGGSILASSFLRARLVNEVWLFHAPLLLGAGISAFRGPETKSLAEAVKLRITSVRQVGDDWLTIGTPDDREEPGCSQD